MIVKPELEKALKSLRLSGILTTLPARVQQASDGAISPLEFLETLLADETDRRRDRLLERRIKLARIDPRCRLDSFDWSFNPKISKKALCELATTRFIVDKENAIFIGPPGTGKSHLAQAIALCTISAGYSALYYQLHDLVETIAEADATGQRKALLTKLLAPNLLILDDLGLKRLKPADGEEILEIIMRRYERSSTIMTSNRPIEDWAKVLGDAATASALLDRLMHHAHMIPFNGKSYRMEKASLDKTRKEV